MKIITLNPNDKLPMFAIFTVLVALVEVAVTAHCEVEAVTCSQVHSVIINYFINQNALLDHRNVPKCMLSFGHVDVVSALKIFFS